MYMRLIGYPAHKISIITTYNGQKSLIRDVIQQRCVNDPRFGAPAKITTVDKFQGQQNDCIQMFLLRVHVKVRRGRIYIYIFYYSRYSSFVGENKDSRSFA
jgi:superfamily I DNA and/or RNA helicase